jgi:hypothetical protein
MNHSSNSQRIARARIIFLLVPSGMSNGPFQQLTANGRTDFRTSQIISFIK